MNIENSEITATTQTSENALNLNSISKNQAGKFDFPKEKQNSVAGFSLPELSLTDMHENSKDKFSGGKKEADLSGGKKDAGMFGGKKDAGRSGGKKDDFEDSSCGKTEKDAEMFGGKKAATEAELLGNKKEKAVELMRIKKEKAASTEKSNYDDTDELK